MWTILELLPLSQNQPCKQGEKFCSFFHYKTENIKLTLGEGRGNVMKQGQTQMFIGDSVANIGNRKKRKHIFNEA
jgi:hypothetical protein